MIHFSFSARRRSARSLSVARPSPNCASVIESCFQRHFQIESGDLLGGLYVPKFLKAPPSASREISPTGALYFFPQTDGFDFRLLGESGGAFVLLSSGTWTEIPSCPAFRLNLAEEKKSKL